MCRESLDHSVHHTSFQDQFSILGSRFHGLRRSPAHCKQRTHIRLSGNSRPTLLLIFGHVSPRPSWITQNLNWVGWSFSCCTPAPSPRNRVLATQPLRPIFPLSHASKCSSRSIGESSGQIYLLLLSQEGWSNRFVEITSLSETASLN